MDDQRSGEYSRAPELEDLVSLCKNLNEQNVKYLLIGGFAVILHGGVRATKDIDLLVDSSPENVARIKRAMSSLPDNAVSLMADDEIQQYKVVRIADEFVVDLMESACGIHYSEAENRIQVREISGIRVPVASKPLLIEMKRTLRPSDKADILLLASLINKELEADQPPKQPLGVKILAWWALIAACLSLPYILFGREIIAKLDPAADPYRFSGLLLMTIGIGISVTMSIGLLRGKRWGWWLGCFSEASTVISSLISLPSLKNSLEQAGNAGITIEHGLLYLQLKQIAAILISILVLSYFFCKKVRSYFKIELPSVARALFTLSVAAAGYGVAIFTLKTLMKRFPNF